MMIKVNKLVLIGSMLLLMVASGMADNDAPVKFKDVPKGHWAEDAVNDLVSQGVTQGYPDGTFRGKKPITRYETAYFLSKLSKSSSNTTDLDSLKNEIKGLKTEVNTLKTNGLMNFTGSYQALGKMANLLTPQGAQGKGPVVNQRFILTMDRNFGEGATVKINLDTMDSGFGGGDANVSSRLLDAVATLKMDLIDWGFDNPVNLRLSTGPGPQQHIDTTGIMRADSGEVYVREYPAVILSTAVLGFDCSGGYIAQAIDASGIAQVSRGTATVSRNLGDWSVWSNLKLGVTGNYLRSTGGEQIDRRGDLFASVNLRGDTELFARLGMAGTTSGEWLYQAGIGLNDPLKTGTVVKLTATKINRNFFKQRLALDLAGYDAFNRYLDNDVTDFSLIAGQILTDKVKIYAKSDLRLSADYKYGKDYPSSRLTAEGGLSYDIASATILDLFYRVDQWPSQADQTSDMGCMDLKVKF